MRRSGIVLLALLLALNVMSCSSNSPGSGESAGNGVTVTPIRSSWPVAREASGQWVVMGEVALRKPTTGIVSLSSITLAAADNTSVLAQKTYGATQFGDMLQIYIRNVDGSYTNTEPAGTSTLKYNSLGFGFVALRSGDASQPTLASVTVAFSDGSSAQVDVPLYAFDPGQQMAWPLPTTTEDWVASNTVGGYYHWTTVFAFPAPGEFFLSQRYAIDAFRIDAGGSTSNPPGSSAKEDYYAWGQDVLSAGSGTVVAVEKNKLDQNPGTEDLQNPLGNFVVVRHGESLYSVYVHMMNGSATVNAGDAVVAGQVLGKVGNSGVTDQPHLHFQFVDDWPAAAGPFVSAMQSQGLPAVFWNVKVNRLTSAALQNYLDPLPSTWDDGINGSPGSYTLNGAMPMNMDLVTAL